MEVVTLTIEERLTNGVWLKLNDDVPTAVETLVCDIVLVDKDVWVNACVTLCVPEKIVVGETAAVSDALGDTSADRDRVDVVEIDCVAVASRLGTLNTD